MLLQHILQQTYQPQQPAASASEYILTIPETQMLANQVTQPVQQVGSRRQQPRGPHTSYLVVEDQQPETSREPHITISFTKAFNLSVALVTGEDTTHTISGLSSLLVIYSQSCVTSRWSKSKLGFNVPFNSQGHIGTGPQHCHLWDSNPQR